MSTGANVPGYTLINPIRDYAWGTPGGISALLGWPTTSEPQAEMWLGAHPASPSSTRALSEDPASSAPSSDVPASGVPASDVPNLDAPRPAETAPTLDVLIDEDPVGMLGEAVASRFCGRLPFLVKILSAAKALSLQVHPSIAQARAGFARENASGIPLGSPERNYQDENHKPEMIYALTAFSALSGFREPQESAALFAGLADLLLEEAKQQHSAPGQDARQQGAAQQDGHPYERSAHFLREVSGHLAQGQLAGQLELLLSAEPHIEQTVKDLSAAVVNAEASASLQLRTVIDTVKMLGEQYPGDAGVLISVLLNRVDLKPGDALYLPAGNIHAYLHGTGIEVMATSDNVLRGGLTPKHVDIPELLHTVSFDPITPPVITAEQSAAHAKALGQLVIPVPFDDFEMQVLEGKRPEKIALGQNGPVIFLVVRGAFVLESARVNVTLSRGQSVFLTPSTDPFTVRPLAHSTEAETESSTPLAFAVGVPPELELGAGLTPDARS